MGVSQETRRVGLRRAQAPAQVTGAGPTPPAPDSVQASSSPPGYIVTLAPLTRPPIQTFSVPKALMFASL